MEPSNDALAQLRAINATAEFNRWCGIEVVDAGPGNPGHCGWIRKTHV